MIHKVGGYSGLVLAIDPGTITGWAVARDGVLILAGHFHKDKRYDRVRPIPIFSYTKVLVEKPVYYPAGKNTKGDPNTLITLGILVGEYAGVYKNQGITVEFVTPMQWKGNVPKDICHNRLADMMRPGEVFPKNHNARDAVGIAFWDAGRYPL